MDTADVGEGSRPEPRGEPGALPFQQARCAGDLGEPHGRGGWTVQATAAGAALGMTDFPALPVAPATGLRWRGKADGNLGG